MDSAFLLDGLKSLYSFSAKDILEGEASGEAAVSTVSWLLCLITFMFSGDGILVRRTAGELGLSKEVEENDAAED